MVILGICHDKGLMDLLLQDARRLHAGLEVEIFNWAADKPRPGAELIKHYQAFPGITLLVIEGGNVPEQYIKEWVEHSDAAFTYYRNNADRWFKFLKNRLKPVSVDYRAPEFWFMLGSIYTSLVYQSNRETEIKARELELGVDQNAAV